VQPHCVVRRRPRAARRRGEAGLAFLVELGDFPAAPPTAGLFDPSYYLRVAGL
jgi:hypothetical protein